MDTFFRKHSNVLTLTMLLVVQVLGLAVQVKRETGSGSTSNLLHVWAIRLIAPIEKGFVHTEESAHYLFRNYFYLRGVRRENDELKRQLDEMRVHNIRLQEDANQARRIQALLGFKEQFIHKTVAAQVIGTSGSDKSCLIYIDRGADDGIRNNMAVITPDGIVGKVLHTQPSTATVLEINDQTSGVGALLAKSRLQGVVKGTPSGDIVLSNIMTDEKVEVGDLITTSGGDQIYPKGLPIGTVSATYPGRDIFLNIRVKPAADLNRLEEVLVITEKISAEPDTKDLGPIRAADILAARLPSVPQQAAPPANTAPGSATPGATAPGATPPAPGTTPPAVPKKSTTTNPPATQPATTQPGTTQPAKKAPATPPASPKTSTSATAAPAAKDSEKKKAPKAPAESSPPTAPSNPPPQVRP